MPWRSRLIASTRSSRSVDELVVLGLDLAQFLLGEQIDRAEPLALAADAVELRLDLGDLRQLGAGLELGELRRCGRLDVEHLADFVLDIGEPALGALAAFLGARGFGARLADRFERAARRLVGLGELGLGLRQPIGGGAASAGRGLDLADQRVALVGEFLRRVGRARCARAALPRCAGRWWRSAPRRSSLRSLQAARSAAIACRRRSASSASRAIACASTRTSASAAAVARDRLVDRGEPAFELGGGRQRGERRLRVAARGVRFVAAGAEPLPCFLERRDARRVAADLALGGGVLLARGIGRVLRLAPARARLGLGGGRGGDRGLGRLDRAALCLDFAARGGKLALDRLRGGRVRRAGARRRSAHGRRRQSRPSARNRPRARPAAGRA